MPGDYPNIYKMARAGTRLTQERAAEILALSVESVKAYESGQRTPPNGTVAAMAAAYEAPWLALRHLLHGSAELGLLAPDCAPQSLQSAVLQLIDLALDFRAGDRGRALLRIACDGVVDESEREDFAEIVGALDALVLAALALKCAKKERPDGGTSKRSKQGEPCPRNKTIISQNHGIARKTFAGEGAEAR